MITKRILTDSMSELTMTLNRLAEHGDVTIPNANKWLMAMIDEKLELITKSVTDIGIYLDMVGDETEESKSQETP